MRRELSKAVRDEFAGQLGRVFPQFRSLKRQKLGSSCQAYSWSIAPDLALFIMLQVSTKAYEEFTVEVAFSEDGRYPIDSLAMLPFNFAGAGIPGIASHPAWRVNLGHLWRQRERTLDYWWEVTPRPSDRELAQRLKDLASRGTMDEMPIEEALKRVGPAVANAMGKLGEYGFPFLREVATHRGIALPTS